MARGTGRADHHRVAAQRAPGREGQDTRRERRFRQRRRLGRRLRRGGLRRPPRVLRGVRRTHHLERIVAREENHARGAHRERRGRARVAAGDVVRRRFQGGGVVVREIAEISLLRVPQPEAFQLRGRHHRVRRAPPAPYGRTYPRVQGPPHQRGTVEGGGQGRRRRGKLRRLGRAARDAAAPKGTRLIRRRRFIPADVQRLFPRRLRRRRLRRLRRERPRRIRDDPSRGERRGGGEYAKRERRLQGRGFGFLVGVGTNARRAARDQG
mmetsp:Transcript_9759/g.39990  ORF Transcript_9759/g.39990 Transcript_9759/m.39990 type:complete len:267 (+) Transcript_9759:170-970(+)